jgi:hypothetical protein
MKRRVRHWPVSLGVLAGAILISTASLAQISTPTSKYAGTAGASCAGLGIQYAWPDINGQILQCVSNVWTVVGQTVAPAGSNGQVQFNNVGSMAGSNNLFWDNSNFRLGIGTASPSRLLNIAGASQPGFAMLETGGTTNQKSMGFIYDGGAAVTGGGLVWEAFTDAGAFSANLSTFFHNGSVNFGGIAAPGTAGQVVFTGGNVGIGTTSPFVLMDLKGNNVSNAGQLRIAATDYDQISFYNSANMDPATSANRLADIYYNVSASTLNIENQTSSKYVNINPTGGNVGIGTTGPLALLSLLYNNSSTTTSALTIDNSGGSQSVMDFRTSNTKRAELRADSSGNFVVEPSGGGDLYLGGLDTVNGTPSGNMHFYTNNGERMRIDRAGPGILHRAISGISA